MKYLLLLMLLLLFLLISCNTKEDKKEIVAYFPEWGVEHQPYYVKHIEQAGSADKLTIINYAFGIPTPDSLGNIIVSPMFPEYAYQQIYDSSMSIDGIGDDSTQALRGHLNQLKKLKMRHPNLRIVISLGGWTGSVYFSDAALTKDSREIFVNSVIEFYIKGDLPLINGAGGKGVAKGIFDGIDIDWEFPVDGGPPGVKNNKNDKENFSKLIKLFRKKLDEINPDFLLTAAVPALEHQLDNFNLETDQEVLDWILLMTYDFIGGWSDTSGHHANIYSAKKDSNYFGTVNSFEHALSLMRTKYNIRESKIIPGVAFYGRGWKMVDTTNNGLYASGIVAPGIYENGHNYYNDIIRLEQRGYEYFWDDKAGAPYLFSKKDKIFWTYDDERSIKLKTNYVKQSNLSGIMFWEISGDDSSGSLVKTIFNTLY